MIPLRVFRIPAVLACNPIVLRAGSYISRPFLDCQIPIPRLAKPRLETFLWLPAKFTADFAGVDAVAQVMPRTVLYERNLLRVGLPIVAGPFFIEDGTNPPYDFDIRLFARCADVVRFAKAAI